MHKDEGESSQNKSTISERKLGHFTCVILQEAKFIKT